MLPSSFCRTTCLQAVALCSCDRSQMKQPMHGDFFSNMPNMPVLLTTPCRSHVAVWAQSPPISKRFPASIGLSEKLCQLLNKGWKWMKLLSQTWQNSTFLFLCFVSLQSSYFLSMLCFWMLGLNGPNDSSKTCLIINNMSSNSPWKQMPPCAPINQARWKSQRATPRTSITGVSSFRSSHKGESQTKPPSTFVTFRQKRNNMFLLCSQMATCTDCFSSQGYVVHHCCNEVLALGHMSCCNVCCNSTWWWVDDDLIPSQRVCKFAAPEAMMFKVVMLQELSNSKAARRAIVWISLPWVRPWLSWCSCLCFWMLLLLVRIG